MCPSEGYIINYNLNKRVAKMNASWTLFRKMSTREGVFPEDVAVAAVAAVIQNYSEKSFFVLLLSHPTTFSR